MREFQSLRNNINRNGADFLRLDLDTALMMARMAAKSEKASERRQRRIRFARKAYDAVLQFRAVIEMEPDDKLELDKQISKLRTALEILGESFN